MALAFHGGGGGDKAELLFGIIVQSSNGGSGSAKDEVYAFPDVAVIELQHAAFAVVQGAWCPSSRTIWKSPRGGAVCNSNA